MLITLGYDFNKDPQRLMGFPYQDLLKLREKL